MTDSMVATSPQGGAGVAEPRWQWVHPKTHRVMVLWSHGRLTEHPRAGAKPAHTHAKHADYADAERIAKRHGFEKVGLLMPATPPPAPEEERMPDRSAATAPAPTAAPPTTAHTTNGNRPPDRVPQPPRGELADETVARALKVKALVDDGVPTTQAIKDVAKAMGLPTGRIHGSYYQWKQREAKGKPELKLASNLTDVGDPKAFAQHLVSLRERRGWTQEEAAKHVGITKWAYSNLERGGINTPRQETVAKLAKAYGTTVDDLVAGARANGTAGKAAAAIAAAQTPRAVPPSDAVQEAVAAVQAAAPDRLVAAAERRSLGVSVVEDEDDDPVRTADRLAGQRVGLFQREAAAIKAAYAALDAEVTAILDRMAKLEEREGQLRQGAAFFGLELPPMRDEAS